MADFRQRLNDIPGALAIAIGVLGAITGILVVLAVLYLRSAS